MFSFLYFVSLFMIGCINCIPIPFIRNVTLVPRYQWNSTTVTNHTYEQCLCMSIPSFVAFNWFPNNTCQLFYTFPITYRIQSTPQARLYFPQQIFPNPSQCCMPDLAYLLDKLSRGITISANIPAPRCIVLDNHGYLVTIFHANRTIVRFYPTNLTIVNQPISPIFTSSPFSIAYYNQTYYVGFNQFILAIDSNDFSILHTITASSLNGVRDIIFLNNGQIMVVASTKNGFLVFFNRSNNYTFVYKQFVNYTKPHGLRYVNDTFFYATSWDDNTIYSYSLINNSGIWMERLFLDARLSVSSPNGNHVTTDECDRYWFSLGFNGIKIFNNQGVFLGNFTQMNLYAFDVVITEDYVIYISDNVNNQIIRIDPNIQC